MEEFPGPSTSGPEARQIVCFGSSAGGLEAMRDVLRSLPVDLPFCYLVAQHLSAGRDSPLAQLLGRETGLEVRFALDGAPLEAGLVLVAPPGSDVTVSAAAVHVAPSAASAGAHPTIDALLRSAAMAWGEQAIAVILSGTGQDGSSGIHAIRSAGGVTIAQDPGGARFPGMPGSAVATGVVDLILPPDEIGPALRRLARGVRISVDVAEAAEGAPKRGAGRPAVIARIVSAVLKATGVDFTGYKLATVQRQIERRMAVVQVYDLYRYETVLTTNPNEARALTSALLVTVTSFFRDPAAWTAVVEPLQALLEQADTTQLRLWVPGCATGQEAYTLGMIVAELLGHPSDLALRLKIFATDLDEDALQVARAGQYPDDLVRSIPTPMRDRWLRPYRDGWEVLPGLRDCLVFARHNVVLDPPFPKIHLVSLRNTLIYFQPRLQERVLRLLHFSLVPGGLLLVGESERVSDNHELFDAVSSTSRLYVRRATRPHGALPIPQPRPIVSPRAQQVGVIHGSDGRAAMRDALIRRFAPPSLVVDDDDDVIEVVGDVSRWCWVADGQHSSHVVALVRDELRPAVRSLLLQVRQGVSGGAERSITAADGVVLVSVGRLEDGNNRPPGTGRMVISFVDRQPDPAVSSSTVAPGRGDRPGAGTAGGADSEIARMTKELASSEAALQSTIEQLSTSNEELQALNEELQAAAEELQSSSEEVQASNEELEATNEELSTLNSELQLRGSDLATANADLENIQASLTSGLILVDRDLRIMRYTPLAVRLFALIGTDIGRLLTLIPSTIDIPDLESHLMAAVNEQKDSLLELRGERSDMLLHFHPYRGGDGAIRGAILVSTDVSELAGAHRAAQRSLRDLVAVTDALREAVWQRSEAGKILFLNSQVETLFGLNRQQVLENPELLLAVVHPEDRERVSLMAAAYPLEPYSSEYRIIRRGQVRWVHESVVIIPADDAGVGFAVSSALDVTGRHQAEDRAREYLESLEAVFDNSVFGVLMLDDGDRVLRANDCMVRMSGYDHASLMGMPVRLLTEDSPLLDPFATARGQERDGALVLGLAHRRLIARDGTPYFVTMETRSLNVDGGPARIVIVHDVTSLTEANRELAGRVMFDQHTGLLVRSHFRDLLGKELARCDRTGTGLAVLWIDLDGFKDVNDRYGHGAGDVVLREVEGRLQQVSRRHDAVGRLGGDEFAMLVTEVNQTDGLEAVVQRVLGVLREPIRLSDFQVYLSGSMGVALAPGDGNDPDMLLHHADTAMYAAKQAGHDRRVYFRKEMNEAAEQRAETRHALADAMRARQFVMHYQPVFSTVTGAMTSVEALIRWTREDGIVAAGEFMTVAAETGQLRAIGRIALDLVDQDLRNLRAELGSEQPVVAVNLSPAQLEERDLTDWLVTWEPAGGFEQVVIEVTEAAALARGGRTVETLTLLRRLGARLSIDDFGTGYSSLELLDRLRPSIIKIDRMLLAQADQARGRAVLHAAVQLAHALEAEVVVEGVENEAHWQLARTLGVEHAQGFHLARPMPLADMISWIREHRNSVEI